MAKILSKRMLQRTIQKRDDALAKISFNESYSAIAKKAAEEQLERQIEKRSLCMKRRLYTLEKKATPRNDLAKQEMEHELAKLHGKQRLPRLAIEQTYLRKQCKMGDETAQQYRKIALAKLNSAEQRVREKWERKIQSTDCNVEQAYAVQYSKALEVQTAKLDTYRHDLAQKVKEKIQRFEQKIQKANINLRERVERYNEKLKTLDAATQDAMQQPDTLLEVSDLVMQFDGLRAVDGLSFEVKEGEIFGLIGPNGAGKTTVFNCVTQFNKLTEGAIYFRNKNGEVIDLAKRKVHTVVETGIVRTFQNLELIWELTVFENMLIGAHSLYHSTFFDHLLHTTKMRREEEVFKARAIQVLERLKLLNYKDAYPVGLPYGILKKIELARTLMINPRLIILDEPAAGLNDAETEELAETISRIRNDYGCTIFLVEHDMGLVMDICDTVCAISFGKKLAMGTPLEIQTSAAVQEAYLGGTMTEE